MNYLFWGLAFTMLIVAILAVVLPLLRIQPTASKPLIMVVLLVPLMAIGLYSGIGSPDTVTAEADPSYGAKVSGFTARNSGPGNSLGSVATLVDGLAERLQREADDAGGWLLLARSYEHLGRHRAASVAYARARALGKTDRKLEETLRSDDDLTTQSTETSEIAIRGRVSLDRAATPLVVDTDTIFIFAKASENQGMPIVAVRKSVADLPIDFVLTDKQAMVPGTSLADFDELFVTARISRSGLANDALAGLSIEGKSISPSTGGFVELTVSPSDMVNNAAEVSAE